MLQQGLYEQLINNEISSELKEIPEACKSVASIDKAEASKILSQYIADITQKGFDNILDNGGNIDEQLELANKIIKLIRNDTKEEYFDSSLVNDPAEQLLAILARDSSLLAANKTAKDMARPVTSIAQSSLFTGALHEPQMYTELKKEIASADSIDMLVSFIKWSGLRLIIDELRDFTQNGGKLRIITTSYMGATDVKAVEELSQLPNTSVKVSYDTKRTRLHAKMYAFYRDTGFTTAYVGSSNLSNAAISSGLEWNVKLTMKDMPETIKKLSATFDYYWNSSEFEYYTEDQLERLSHALKSEKYSGANNAEIYTMDVMPYPYQQEILDKLQAEREVRGFNKNLIVAATGTGKTVIAAIDYRGFCRRNPGQGNRILFVAHREEILKQSINTFRAVLKDANFGELYVGNYKPDSIDHLFISVQTFNSQDLTAKTTKDFYDYIVIDEFHHAAAPTYQKLLDYYEPKLLIGLTATPERMDGRSILSYFNNRIAAEIRLPEAIERKLLCPFQYFGVTDTIDLNDLRWSRGGYDKTELSSVYTLNILTANRRADLVIASIMKYVTDINDVKGLGFCVSIEHAAFMSEYFNAHGIASICLTGNSSDEERNTAKDRLVTGRIRFIFVVDIYNEGVDIPEVNTVLFLRPTESLTIFLQQLGRGLRLAENKDCLTVLDFIGQANKRYNFEDKFAALLSGNECNISKEIKDGFVSAPKGCYIQLEKKAASYVLENIRASYGSTRGLISRIASFEEDTGIRLSLSAFLEYYHMDPRAIYRYASFSRLCTAARVRADFNEAAEDILTKALARFAVIDSRRWISFLTELLDNIDSTDLASFTESEKRMFKMFYYTVYGSYCEEPDSTEVLENIIELTESPVMLSELIDLLKYRYEQIDFIDGQVDVGFDCPLDLHCTYSRDQILTAMDFARPATVREGVKWLKDKNIDLLFVTLNKSDKDYSPTTMYNDYSINESLFHWQSQSTTNEESATGQRYIHHKEKGSRVLLFVREHKTDSISGNAESYSFLGTAEYVRHEGSRPMNITWQLDHPIPARFLKKTNKLMAG